MIRHAPDLCIEVLSPSTSGTDRGKKMQMFARYGVEAYWIVDPVAETLELYDLAADGYRLRTIAAGEQMVASPGLPGFSFAAHAAFPDR